MGFLVKGKPLSWKESKSVRAYVKEHGIDQFIQIWRRNKDREDLDFLWGDEVEGFLVKTTTTPEGKRRVKLSLRGFEVLEKLDQEEERAMKEAEKKAGCGTCPPSVIFHPEYGRFMIETTPSGPYGGYTRDLRCVEANMRIRREKIRKFLLVGEIYSTMTTYPLMGVKDFTIPSYKPNGPVALSLYVPDELINPHPRFATLTANIRTRRGSKVDIRVPLFKDKNTPQNEHEIHMDAMAFGMGCCCLQVTFLSRNLEEARNLYDHLAVLGPIMLSLTAATPFYRGKIADTDVRWSVISQSVDDRTPNERGFVVNGERKKAQISKSRYDSISCYISEEESGYFKEKYNDLDVQYDGTTYRRLLKEGVDKVLAKHISHLWIRDPLVIYENRIKLDDKKDVDHFENIQSTNWQSVRFKPPPSDNIGWRVEFRTMEVQITDFENAAFTVFIALVSRAILAFHLNLYIPISMVDANMKTAHKRDSVTKEKFLWRKSLGDTITKHMRDLVTMNARNDEFKSLGKSKGGNGASVQTSGHMKSIIEVKEADFKDDTLDNFLQMKTKHRFVIIYGEVDPKTGKSWCPGCARSLPIVEHKIQAFKAGAALLKLPVSQQKFCGNKQHPYRVDERLCISSIPAVIRVEPNGFFSRPLGAKWCTDTFCVNQYMSTIPARRLRGGSSKGIVREKSLDDAVTDISIEEIMCGDGESGPLGLIPIVHAYLDMVDCDARSRKVVNRYLSLIEDRAKGKLMTAAAWLRKYVALHPEYKSDSQLSESVVHDMLKTCDGLTEGDICAPQLLGDYANTCSEEFVDRGGEVVRVGPAKKKLCLDVSEKKGTVCIEDVSEKAKNK
mmetsp:Transcript_16796/g.23526  ORF Transcript_16796/g.23526 Transcript_16796/m.23526 type:complete len:841 (-) Transcript_16796:220-2742(-)|eukprot:CAMPEP_0184485162 /NCGR_PEP_ID=MMETSP0113_2-20130426/6809_1 /TAXON_ID=91329 /ORGANISM="Norrisiella sphaerica, Strain BC52" /LENGTH=840 /DNA_ID=CAMNT_0026866489 /DNA_START=141 /DNA_END=2663 /DNA_ORIENTATION=-